MVKKVLDQYFRKSFSGIEVGAKMLIFFANWVLGVNGGWLPLPTHPQQYHDLSLVLVCLSACVGGLGSQSGLDAPAYLSANIYWLSGSMLK